MKKCISVHKRHGNSTLQLSSKLYLNKSTCCDLFSQFDDDSNLTMFRCKELFTKTEYSHIRWYQTDFTKNYIPSAHTSYMYIKWLPFHLAFPSTCQCPHLTVPTCKNHIISLLVAYQIYLLASARFTSLLVTIIAFLITSLLCQCACLCTARNTCLFSCLLLHVTS